MEIIKTFNGNQITLSLVGRLNTNTAGELEAVIETLQEGGDVTLECSKLEYLSSAGLRVLLLFQKRVGKQINSLTLENVIEDVYEVLDMTGFSSILNIK